MSGSDPQSADGEGLEWSDWLQLDAAIVPHRAIAPNVSGVYRLRVRDEPGLIYIGETGRSIRERFRHIRKAAQYVAAGIRKPGSAPHVAGGCVLVHERRGAVVDVSWIEMPEVDKRERRGRECDLISAYRKLTGQSPTCQFAGMPGREIE